MLRPVKADLQEIKELARAKFPGVKQISTEALAKWKSESVFGRFHICYDVLSTGRSRHATRPVRIPTQLGPRRVPFSWMGFGRCR